MTSSSSASSSSCKGTVQMERWWPSSVFMPCESRCKAWHKTDIMMVMQQCVNKHGRDIPHQQVVCNDRGKQQGNSADHRPQRRTGLHGPDRGGSVHKTTGTILSKHSINGISGSSSGSDAFIAPIPLIVCGRNVVLLILCLGNVVPVDLRTRTTPVWAMQPSGPMGPVINHPVVALCGFVIVHYLLTGNLPAQFITHGCIASMISVLCNITTCLQQGRNTLHSHQRSICLLCNFLWQSHTSSSSLKFCFNTQHM